MYEPKSQPSARFRCVIDENPEENWFLNSRQFLLSLSPVRSSYNLQCFLLTSRFVIGIRHTLTLHRIKRAQGRRTERNHFPTQLRPETGCKHINLHCGPSFISILFSSHFLPSLLACLLAFKFKFIDIGKMLRKRDETIKYRIQISDAEESFFLN